MTEPPGHGRADSAGARSRRAPDGRAHVQGNWPGADDQPPDSGNLPGPPDAQIQGIHHSRPGAPLAGGLTTPANCGKSSQPLLPSAGCIKLLRQPCLLRGQRTIHLALHHFHPAATSRQVQTHCSLRGQQSRQTKACFLPWCHPAWILSRQSAPQRPALTLLTPSNFNR